MKSNISFLKLVVIMLLQWLCGCSNSNNNYIMQLNYADSISTAARRIQEIELHKQAIRDRYHQQFPVAAFPRTPGGDIARKQYRKIEQAGYQRMLDALNEYEVSVIFESNTLRQKCVEWQKNIDSLKQINNK